MNHADTHHRTTPLERGVCVRSTVIHIEPFGQTRTLDGRAQHILAGTRVLVGHPVTVQQQARVIVDQDEEVGRLLPLVRG